MEDSGKGGKDLLSLIKKRRREVREVFSRPVSFERRMDERKRLAIGALIEAGQIKTHCVRCPKHVLKKDERGKPVGGNCSDELKPIIENKILLRCEPKKNVKKTD